MQFTKQFEILENKYKVKCYGYYKNLVVNMRYKSYTAKILQKDNRVLVCFEQHCNKIYDRELHNFVAAAHYCNNVLSATEEHNELCGKLDKLISRQYR